MEIQNEIVSILTSVAVTAIVVLALWGYRRYQSKKKTS